MSYRLGSKIGQRECATPSPTEQKLTYFSTVEMAFNLNNVWYGYISKTKSMTIQYGQRHSDVIKF